MKRRLALAGAVLVLGLGGLSTVFQLGAVPDGDMAPSILKGELILLGPAGELERGDVVLIEDPGEPGRRVLRRVAALEGGEVLLSGGGLVVDGQGARLAEMGRSGQDIVLSEANRYLIQRHDRRFAEPDRSWEIQHGELFLLADEREGPVDSRSWGPVPASEVQARLWWRVTGSDAWRSAPAQRAQDGPWIPVSKQQPQEPT